MWVVKGLLTKIMGSYRYIIRLLEGSFIFRDMPIVNLLLSKIIEAFEISIKPPAPCSSNRKPLSAAF